MKLLYGNGAKVEVYDISGPVYRVRAGTVPIKFNGYRILEDDAARAVLRELLDTGVYEGERCET